MTTGDKSFLHHNHVPGIFNYFCLLPISPDNINFGYTEIINNICKILSSVSAWAMPTLRNISKIK